MRSEYAANLALQQPLKSIQPAPVRSYPRKSLLARIFNIFN